MATGGRKDDEHPDATYIARANHALQRQFAVVRRAARWNDTVLKARGIPLQPPHRPETCLRRSSGGQ